MKMRAVKMISLGLLASALLLGACSSKKRYPDPNPGWHAEDYHEIFGRLQRVPSKDPEGAPLWIIRYGFNNADKYSGKLNLTPGEKMVGYNGGELVHITGALQPNFTNAEFGGSWYQINTIRLWVSTKEQ